MPQSGKVSFSNNAVSGKLFRIWQKAANDAHRLRPFAITQIYTTGISFRAHLSLPHVNAKAAAYRTYSENTRHTENPLPGGIRSGVDFFLALPAGAGISASARASDFSFAYPNCFFPGDWLL